MLAFLIGPLPASYEVLGEISSIIYLFLEGEFYFYLFILEGEF